MPLFACVVLAFHSSASYVRGMTFPGPKMDCPSGHPLPFLVGGQATSPGTSPDGAGLRHLYSRFSEHQLFPWVRVRGGRFKKNPGNHCYIWVSGILKKSVDSRI